MVCHGLLLMLERAGEIEVPPVRPTSEASAGRGPPRLQGCTPFADRHFTSETARITRRISYPARSGAGARTRSARAYFSASMPWPVALEISK